MHTDVMTDRQTTYRSLNQPLNDEGDSFFPIHDKENEMDGWMDGSMANQGVNVEQTQHNRTYRSSNVVRGGGNDDWLTVGLDDTHAPTHASMTNHPPTRPNAPAPSLRVCECVCGD